ncbi:MAG: ribosome-binding factor A [Deltaproteobacteria bacterium RIFCSPLOWO2_12_FULL_60_19]|nr:MAG: ribosome-binding factor A [Deltaproteobacteria bacterium RIFCSPLOWO2_12_FULL_60_19]
MDYNRSDRVGDLLLELVSQLLMKEVSDPRIGAITLTGAEVSKDLRHAKIYFSILEGSEKKTQVASGLKSATGFIRGRVAKDLKLRFVPTIEFIYDETEDRARRIEDLLKQADVKKTT